MFKALFFFFKKETNFLRDSRDPHTIQPVFSWNVTRVLNFAFTCIMVEALSDLQVFIGHGMQGAIEYIYIYILQVAKVTVPFLTITITEGGLVPKSVHGNRTLLVTGCETCMPSYS